MISGYRDSAPPDPTVYRRIREFKESGDSFENEQRNSGRPKTSRSENYVIVVQKAVQLDRHATIDAIAEEASTSHGSTCIYAILTENRGLNKLNARWVPHRLRSEHRTQSIECANREDFYSRIVTGDETWIYHYDSDFKIQSKESLPRSTYGPKFCSERSVAKVLAVFWEAEGVILVDFLKDLKSLISIATYYEAVLWKLRREIAKKTWKVEPTQFTRQGKP